MRIFKCLFRKVWWTAAKLHWLYLCDLVVFHKVLNIAHFPYNYSPAISKYCRENPWIIVDKPTIIVRKFYNICSIIALWYNKYREWTFIRSGYPTHCYDYYSTCGANKNAIFQKSTSQIKLWKDLTIQTSCGSPESSSLDSMVTSCCPPLRTFAYSP